LQVPLHILKVQANAAKGESPEDAARKARYKAFDAVALENKAQIAINSIAFAHNSDDQVETVLLALSRGSGLAGLSAMPVHWQRGGKTYYRPLLEVSAADIRSWLLAQGQHWVEDPTNADLRFTRNRIRHCIVPALREAFPHVADAFSRSARHAAQAQTLLDALAQQDLAQWSTEEALPDGLPIQGLRELAVERQANVLRYWLKARFGAVASAAQLDQLQRQLQACCTRGHRIHIRMASGFIHREGRLLTWYSA
jgi:tRNA(Ile)-lysidine synthase